MKLVSQQTLQSIGEMCRKEADTQYIIRVRLPPGKDGDVRNMCHIADQGRFWIPQLLEDIDYYRSNIAKARMLVARCLRNVDPENDDLCDKLKSFLADTDLFAASEVS